MAKEHSRHEGLALEVVRQGLDVINGKPVNIARKKCENTLTLGDHAMILHIPLSTIC
jgi:hypothetical protein